MNLNGNFVSWISRGIIALSAIKTCGWSDLLDPFTWDSIFFSLSSEIWSNVTSGSTLSKFFFKPPILEQTHTSELEYDMVRYSLFCTYTSKMTTNLFNYHTLNWLTFVSLKKMKIVLLSINFMSFVFLYVLFWLRVNHSNLRKASFN